MSGEDQVFSADDLGAPVAGYAHNDDSGEEFKEDKVVLCTINLEAGAWQPYASSQNGRGAETLLPSISLEEAKATCQDHYNNGILVWHETIPRLKWEAHIA